MSYDALEKLQGTVVPKLLGAYLASFPDRELVDDRTFLVLLQEHIPGRKLSKLKRWEAEFMSDTIRANVSAAVEAVNNLHVYFMTGLDESLRITEDWKVRFGDLFGSRRIVGKVEKLRVDQENAIKYALFRCNVISKKELGIP